MVVYDILGAGVADPECLSRIRTFPSPIQAQKGIGFPNSHPGAKKASDHGSATLLETSARRCTFSL